MMLVPEDPELYEPFIPCKEDEFRNETAISCTSEQSEETSLLMIDSSKELREFKVHFHE